VKVYIQRHPHELRQYDDLVFALLEATSCITADKAFGWFKNAGYIVT
jgi:hypothetical protein